jgi:hypothetical protein
MIQNVIYLTKTTQRKKTTINLEGTTEYIKPLDTSETLPSDIKTARSVADGTELKKCYVQGRAGTRNVQETNARRWKRVFFCLHLKARSSVCK